MRLGQAKRMTTPASETRLGASGKIFDSVRRKFVRAPAGWDGLNSPILQMSVKKLLVNSDAFRRIDLAGMQGYSNVRKRR